MSDSDIIYEYTVTVYRTVREKAKFVIDSDVPLSQVQLNKRMIKEAPDDGSVMGRGEWDQIDILDIEPGFVWSERIIK